MSKIQFEAITVRRSTYCLPSRKNRNQYVYTHTKCQSSTLHARKLRLSTAVNEPLTLHTIYTSRFDLSRDNLERVFEGFFDHICRFIFSLPAVGGAFAAVLRQRTSSAFAGRLDGRLLLSGDTFADFGEL